MIEKFLGFQDFEVKLKLDELSNALSDFINEHMDGAIEEVLRAREYIQARDFYINNMYWQEGIYILEMALHEPKLSSPHKQKFRISLTPEDVKRLRKNTQDFESYIRAIFSNQVETKKGEEPSVLPRFEWVNTRFEVL